MERIVNEQDIATLVKMDKIFADILAAYQSPINYTRPPGFETLSKIILEQQVSLAAANAHFLKLSTYVNKLTPAAILKLSDEEMRSCQISRQKSFYLRSLASAIINKTLNLKKLSAKSEDFIRMELTKIKGIGNWTVDMYLMFCLQAKDIFPIGDVALFTTMRELTAARTTEEIIAYAERWRPLRSLATYFLWHYYLEKRRIKNS